jgi:RNA binding exosome subunit
MKKICHTAEDKEKIAEILKSKLLFEKGLQ